MASLKRLYLQGVRSFGAAEGDEGSMAFSSPLTLILGQNGCGKTTLIEALKYATSGELPTNSRTGAYFVHDPKLTSFIETMGQIKLTITDVKGNPITITRTFKAVQKLKELSFSTGDITIKRHDENGKPVTLSRKCADATFEMCQAMGVSKAILNYVIFCHQEESNWPLEGGLKLKKRFDDIFDSTKYNNCLDHLKKYRESIKRELKQKHVELQYLSEYKNESSLKRTALTEKEAQLAACKDKIKSLENKLLPIEEKLDEITEKERNYNKLYTSQETTKEKLNSVKSTIQEYRNSIPNIFDGSDDDLLEAINNFQNELKKKQDSLEELEKKEELLAIKIKKLQASINEEQKKMGQISRDADIYKKRIESRNNDILNLCADLDISTTMSQLSECNEVPNILSSLKNALSNKGVETETLKKEHEIQETKIQTQIDTLRLEKGKLEQSIEHKKLELSRNKTDLSKLKADILEVEQSSEKLDALKAKLRTIKKELDEMNESSEVEHLSNEIEDARKKRTDFDNNLINLESEIQLLQAYTATQAELDVKKESKASKDAEIKKLKSKHEDSIKKILGEFPEQGVKYQLQAFFERITDEIKSKKEEQKLVEKEVATYETERKHLSEKLRSTKQNLASDECIIHQACSGKDFESVLNDLSKKVQELQDQKGTLTSSEYMFRRYAQKLQQKNPCCPLCHQNFPGEDDVNNLINELTKKVKELPQKLRSNKNELDSFQQKYTDLLQLKPKYEKLSSLKNIEIPNLQKELDAIDIKLNSSQERLAVIQAELVVPVSDESLAKKIQGDIFLLDQQLSESTKLSWEISKLESKLPLGERRSLKEAQQEQTKLRQELKKLQSTIDSCQTKKNDIISRRQKLQEEKNYIQDQQIKISGNVQKYDQLTEKYDELESLGIMLETELLQVNEESSSITRKLDQASREIKKLSTMNSKALQEFQRKVQILRQRNDEIDKIHRQITEYEMSGGNERLKMSQENLEKLEKEGDVFQATKEELAEEKSNIKDLLSSQKVRERELDDNLKMRHKITEESNLNQQLMTIKQKLGNLDCPRLISERNELENDIEKIKKEKARAEGRRTELFTSINELKVELNKETLKNADKNYKDKLIDIKVCETATEDLSRYYVAMDWAVMNFHKERMRSINAIIRDLWRRVYTGNDIDTIEIKAEAEVKPSADKKRVYDYKVVQIKNGVELDMPGRCSAGQKVLASLIIRMALAETFSANCGVLALDEPTTNLDEKNIASLSSALNDLVINHMKRKNFQLILITHDHNFIDVLTQLDEITHYYEVKRNNQGKSKIEKVYV